MNLKKALFYAGSIIGIGAIVSVIVDKIVEDRLDREIEFWENYTEDIEGCFMEDEFKVSKEQKETIDPMPFTPEYMKSEVEEKPEDRPEDKESGFAKEIF